MQIYAKVWLGGMRIKTLLSCEVMKGIGKVTFPSCLGVEAVLLVPRMNSKAKELIRPLLRHCFFAEPPRFTLPLLTVQTASGSARL